MTGTIAKERIGEGVRRPGHAALPLASDISLVYPLTSLVAALLFISSLSGLLYGGSGLYDVEAETLPALFAQDALALVLGIPLLLGSAWRAQGGSTRALLCWMGMLFYVAYFWYFYIFGVPFTVLFPAYIGLVSMSMYGVLALLFALDLEILKARFDLGTPVRAIAVFLMTTALFFAGLWLSAIANHLLAGTGLDRVSHLVIAVDGVVLLPLTFAGGWWLWRRRALGYAVAGLLLVQVAATFFTLLTSTFVTLGWGGTVDPLSAATYTVGLLLALTLLILYLRHIRDFATTLKRRRPNADAP